MTREDVLKLFPEATDEQINQFQTYMKFTESGLLVGKSDSAIKSCFENDRLVFYMNDTPMAYFSDNKLYVAQAEISDLVWNYLLRQSLCDQSFPVA